MGFLRRPSVVVADDSAVAAAEAPSLAGTPYMGDKKPIFREGFFYLCDTDPDGNELGPDISVPLVWRDGGFHYALPDDPNHFHAHGLSAVDLSPGEE